MVADHQPAKLAAMEGHFRTGPANLSIIGWPDEQAAVTHFDVNIPGMLSFLVHNDTKAPVIGLDKVPRQYWPPVAPTFFTYHAMVGIGILFVALTLAASFLRWRRTLFRNRWLMWTFVFAVVPAVAANQLGWAAAEIGRQPWTVHPRVERDAAGQVAYDQAGMLKYKMEEALLTSHAVSEVVSSSQVIGSIVMFGVIYLLLAIIWVLVLNHKIHHGPVPVVPPPVTTDAGLIAAAAGRADHEASMTEAKESGRGGQE
jgi:cytochrome d ubiquinol oxidase subunit I